MRIRPATAGEIPALEALIARSARALSRGYYNEAETEAAIAHVFGIDSDLIADGSYLVAETSDGFLLGCGGWSARRTLFGGDRFAGRELGILDPAQEPARIRTFFVAPEAARAGVASRLLTACESAAVERGFTATTLVATLPGVPFYAARGYVADPATAIEVSGVRLHLVPMRRSLLQK